MKILHLIFSLNVGGSESMMVDIANIQSTNNEVYVYILNSAYNQALVESFRPEINIRQFNRKEGSKNPFKVLEINVSIMKLRPDIIHCHDADINKILFIHPFLKTLLTVHAIDLPLVRINRFNKIVAISLSVKKYLVANGVSNVSVLYNGIDLCAIKYKTQQRTSDVFRIIQVSRLNHLIKGQHILLKALRILKHQYGLTNIHVDFIGEGDSYSYLKELVSRYDLEDNVTFLGIKNRQFIYSTLHNYDLLVQPSIIEGFGLTVAEGLAAKVPVLISANDGPMEVVQNGKYGYYFKKEDFVDCAYQIKKIITTSEGISKLSEDAYQYCLNSFDIYKTAENYCCEYKKIINSKS